jgi:hypothetical protein
VQYILMVPAIMRNRCTYKALNWMCFFEPASIQR